VGFLFLDTPGVLAILMIDENTLVYIFKDILTRAE